MFKHIDWCSSTGEYGAPDCSCPKSAEHSPLHEEADRMWAVIKKAQDRMTASGITGPDDLSWGDTILNLAAAIMIIHPANTRNVGGDSVRKAASTLLHPDTIRELVRLSEILNATEGFESKSLVQRNEALDDRL